MDFTGQRLDGTGLHFYVARYYSSELGRFVQADVMVPDAGRSQAYNRYAYNYDNPVRYTDPSGYCAIQADGNIDAFDCTASDFDSMTVSSRIQWIEQFMIQSDSKDWFHNISGILWAFQEKGLAQPGSWLSLVDAGILQAIQDGYALSESIISASTNTGADEWKTFFDAIHGQDVYKNKNVSDAEKVGLWGIAEVAGTAYGQNVLAAGLKPDADERLFLGVGDVYRAGGVKTLGGAVGGTFGFLAGGGAGLVACGPLCAVGGFVAGAGVGNVSGAKTGEWLTDPRADIAGRNPVYYMATAILR